MSEPQQGLLIPPPTPAEKDTDELHGFVLLELFGHLRIVGMLSQKAVGSEVLLRIDVPNLTSSGQVIREGFTRYFNPKAVYSMTPISEEVLLKLLPSIDGTPVEARALTSRSYSGWNGRDQDEDEEN
jgi:hypothetical protein